MRASLGPRRRNADATTVAHVHHEQHHDARGALSRPRSANAEITIDSAASRSLYDGESFATQRLHQWATADLPLTTMSDGRTGANFSFAFNVAYKVAASGHLMWVRHLLWTSRKSKIAEL